MIKKGDKIIVLAGKDKGKTGTVERVLPKEDMIIVSGVNIKKKHRRARKTNEKGSIVEVASPFHISNAKKADK